MRHVRAALATVLTAAVAGAVALPELLARVAAEARAPAPLRADGRLAAPGGTPHPIILLARGDALYVEVRDGVRALVRPDRIDVAGGGAPGAPLAGSDLVLEDLRPFAADGLRFPQVSDEGPDGVVVTGAPARPSAYALLVHTIDPERAVVVGTQYYAGTVSNLVKRRRDGAWTRVGSAWRPGEIVVEGFTASTRTTLVLRWAPAPDAPAALFEPAGLERPSGLAWP